jgi:hypothetical protein
MKKSYTKHHNADINLAELFIIIWEEKIKITLITVIISAILIGYNHNKPKNPNVFYNSLEIGPAKEEQFLSLLSVYNYLNKEISSESIFKKFLEEFLDYDELIFVLKNDKDVQEELSQLSELKQQQMLNNYAKLFKIIPAEIFYGGTSEKSMYEKYVIEFSWKHESEKTRSILDQTLKLTFNNLGKSIFFKLNNDYEIKKNKIINSDAEQIAYLVEQSTIAKKLNLEENKIDIYNLSDLQASFNFNSGGLGPYYFRGYKAIDMEISVVQNRKYPQLEEIGKKIDLLKKKDFEWVNYNIFHLDVKLKNPKEPTSLVVLILFSLLIAVFYALISNKLKSYINTRKITK